MTIEELAEKNSEFIPPRVYGFNTVFLRTEVKHACAKIANDVLRQIENIYYSETDIVTIITKIHRKILELKGEQTQQ